METDFVITYDTDFWDSLDIQVLTCSLYLTSEAILYHVYIQSVSNNGVRMDESKDPDYESARLDYVGFVDPYALEGLLILKSDDGREFLMRAFSGEVAKNIKSFSDGGERESTIYAMFEDVCEQNGDVLVKVKIYESGEALRANLYLTGKKDTILRNYRASDAVALAIFYGIPILVKNTL